MPPFKHPRVGEVRPSQVIFSYGVGALVDLPHLSVLVLGTDDWTVDTGVARVIEEERLLRTVRWQLGSQVQRLLAPPAVPAGAGPIDPLSDLQRVGIPVALFPRWMLCPKCQRLAPLSSGLFARREDTYHPDRTRYLHTNCEKEKQPTAVPARFLVACEHGHLDDFPWVEFAHRGPTTCPALLRLIEYGPSGEARDLELRCDTCQARRRLAEAFGEEGRARMPQCRGRRPHLRDYDPAPCSEQVRAILLGASNLWFGDTVVALSIPTESVKLLQLVEANWTSLQLVQSEQFITAMRAMAPASFAAFVGYSDHEIWEAIERKKGQAAAVTPADDDPADLKGREWEQLTDPASHTPTKDFQLREVPVPSGFTGLIKRVVLVERLREVRALLGFTRIDAPGELGENPDNTRERRVPLSRKSPAWVPAAEVRGEGIFLEFDEAALQRWGRQPTTQRRRERFLASHMKWREARRIPDPSADFPEMRYALMHTLSHALMRQFVLECGYTAPSLRERIYAREPDAEPGKGPMAGVLIYTAAPDSEGTLGGLVSLGEPERLRLHLQAALRDAGQCASDPLCAEHEPSTRGTTVHAAACHACLFAPETSCERGNKYLDRSVLVPTVEREDLAFFQLSTGS